jgi:hypothetical protein
MFLTIFLTLLLLVLIYLLVMPIVLLIDTTTNQYYIQIRGLVKASLEAHKEELIQIKLNVFFLKFYFYPLQKIGSKKKPRLIAKKKKKRGKKPDFQTGVRLLKSFKVKKLFVDIDTGDCILNAKLYPFVALLKYYSGDINVNFQGRNQLILCVQNRPVNIIRSFINL